MTRVHRSVRLTLAAGLLASACALVSNGEFDGLGPPGEAAGMAGATSMGGSPSNNAGRMGRSSDGGVSSPAAGAPAIGGTSTNAGAPADAGFAGQVEVSAGAGGIAGMRASAEAGMRGYSDPDALQPVLAPQKFGGWTRVPTTGLPNGGVLSSDPGVAMDSAKLAVFARGYDGALWQTTGTGSDAGSAWTWAEWTPLGTPPGGFLLGMVSATTADSGSVRVAVTGRGGTTGSHEAFVRVYSVASEADTGSWSPWSRVNDESLDQDPAITFQYPYLFVFAPGADHQFYFSKNDISAGFDPDGWSKWSLIPDQFFATSAAAAASNAAWQFVVASQGDGYYYLSRSKTNGNDWMGWDVIPSGALTFQSQPALALTPNGQLVVCGTNLSSGVWCSVSEDNGASWGQFQWVPDLAATSAPGVVSRANGTLEVVTRGPDSALWLNPYRE